MLESWALDIRFLIGLLTFLAILFVLTVAVWTGLKIWIHRVRQRRARQEDYERRCHPDGRPRPPMAEGICDACQGAFDTVYHLPKGRRLCPKCYEARHEA
ncbi:MAG: hypothetical protein JXQ75_12000 [Phycisphaerae bacterium]|nr:hypothetical protein [Phycisphaerae bacterium]